MSKAIEYNVETGEEIVRDLTSEELAHYAKMESEQKAIEEAKKANEIAKAELLAKLGITTEEAALLLS